MSLEIFFVTCYEVALVAYKFWGNWGYHFYSIYYVYKIIPKSFFYFIFFHFFSYAHKMKKHAKFMLSLFFFRFLKTFFRILKLDKYICPFLKLWNTFGLFICRII